ncbi:MAG: hypothetical protein P8Y92_01480 [Halioglobus sp.]|jgi:hypothetical protein
MSDEADETLDRAEAKIRELQRHYEKAGRMQRTNCVLFMVLALAVGFLVGAALQDYFSEPQRVIIVPAEDCLSV